MLDRDHLNYENFDQVRNCTIKELVNFAAKHLEVVAMLQGVFNHLVDNNIGLAKDRIESYLRSTGEWIE